MKLTSYVTTVLEDGDDLVITFPDSLMEDMGWKPGDVLEWTIQDNKATIKKAENPEQILRNLEGETGSTE